MPLAYYKAYPPSSGRAWVTTLIGMGFDAHFVTIYMFDLVEGDWISATGAMRLVAKDKAKARARTVEG